MQSLTIAIVQHRPTHTYIYNIYMLRIWYVHYKRAASTFMHIYIHVNQNEVECHEPPDMILVERIHCVTKNIISHYISLSCDFDCSGMLRFQKSTVCVCRGVTFGCVMCVYMWLWNLQNSNSLCDIIRHKTVNRILQRAWCTMTIILPSSFSYTYIYKAYMSTQHTHRTNTNCNFQQ